MIIILELTFNSFIYIIEEKGGREKMGKNKEAHTSRAIRKWFLFLIIFAPGIFFIAYWYYFQPNHAPAPSTAALPETYLEGGTKTTYNGISIQAGESNQAITSNVVKLPNNKVIADPGLIFWAVPIYLSQPESKINWQLIDSDGRVYNPLPVDQNAVAELIERERGVKMFPQRYLLFKVKASTKQFYLIADIAGKKTAWRFVASPY